MPGRRSNVGPPDEEGPPDAAQAGRQLPPDQPELRHQVPQACQLRSGSAGRAAPRLRRLLQRRSRLVERGGHAMGSCHRP